MSSTWIAAGCALYLALGTTWLGRIGPSYSALRQTLSELGAAGAPHARCANYGIFLPVGLSCTWLAWHAAPFSAHRLLATALAAGYLGAVAWPLDNRRRPRQVMHLLCGGLEYLGGLGALFLLPAHATPATAIRWFALSLLLALQLPPRWLPAGLAQRLLEAILFSALILTA